MCPPGPPDRPSSSPSSSPSGGAGGHGDGTGAAGGAGAPGDDPDGPGPAGGGGGDGPGPAGGADRSGGPASPVGRLRARLGTATDDGRPLPVGLTLLAAGVAAAVVAPVGWLVLTALRVDPGAAVETLARPATLQVVINSLLAVALVTVASVLVGVPLAYLTVRTDLPFRRALTVAVAMPLVIPSYIGAIALAAASGPNGELARLLAPLGVDSLPSVYGLEGTVLVLTLYTYPYVYVSTRAALKTMDERLVDAARTLGRSRRGALRRVVVPQVRPAVTAGALLVALYAISDFGTPAIMRYDVFTRVIFVNRYDLEFASLLSLQLVGATLFLLAVESRVRGRTGDGGAGTRRGTVSLGPARWPAAAACGAVAAVALLLPIGILGLWLFRAGPTGDAVGFGVGYVLNSVGVAAAAAVVAAGACLPVAYLAVRYRGTVGELLARATYVGYAVPGVVIGLALVFFGSRFLAPVYQTLPLLVFAYVVRFLPQAVGTTRASLLQVDPDLQAAARTLGRSPRAAFREVTLPLVAPGVLAGAALVFLTTMKELPATLLLRPTGFETLVLRVWRAESAGYPGAAAVPALVLVAVSALSMVVVLRAEGYEGVSVDVGSEAGPDGAGPGGDAPGFEAAADGGTRRRPRPDGARPGGAVGDRDHGEGPDGES